MIKPLDRLVDMTLLATEADAELASLKFTGCTFSAYSRHASSKPLASLVGLTVQSVACTAQDALVINFSTGESFSVSLQANDYVGPEAFCAAFNDGPWVVA